MHGLNYLLLVIVLLYCGFLVSAASACSTALSAHYLVNNQTGNDSLCLVKHNVPCKSLNPLMNCLSGKEDISVLIETNISFSGLMDVNNSRNITISGKNDAGVSIRCGSNSGFNFYNITHFILSHITISNCGWEVDQRNFHYSVAMMFYSSSNLMFQNVIFSNCSFTALAFFECSNNITLRRVKFLHNGIRRKWDKSDSSYAAGVTVEISKDSSNYSFIECLFSHNIAPKNRISSKGALLKDRGLGGALSVVMVGTASGNHLTIENSAFYSNRAKQGGGFYVDYRDDVNNNTILIRSTIFKRNLAIKAGGGVNIGYIDVAHEYSNQIEVESCHFVENTAVYGGGLALTSKFFRKNSTRSIVRISDSTWSKNTGNLGAAVDLTPKDTTGTQMGYLPRLNFKNCTFVDNKMTNKYKLKIGTLISSGVFIATNFNVYFELKVNFTRNQYTALYLLTGSAIFHPSTVAIFDSNIGYNGGAIALYSSSSLVVGKHANLTFINNHAYALGGGIYSHTIDQHDFMTMSKICFIRTGDILESESDEKAVITFTGNAAKAGGKSIYSESFKECFRFCVSSKKERLAFDYLNTFNCLGNFTFDEDDEGNNSYALVSSGRQFNLTNFKLSAIPGSSLNLNFKEIDDYNHTIKSLVYINHKEEDSSHGNIIIEQPYTLSDAIIVPKGSPNSVSNFTVTFIGVRQYSFDFNLALLQCPPGFYYTNNSMTCECTPGKRGYAMVQKCAYSTYTAQIKAGYWVGYIPMSSLLSQDDLFYAPCSKSMCRTIHNLPNSTVDLENHVCQRYRTGVLCGQCVQNFSAYYNSREYACRPSHYCRFGLLFYFLSEITPMLGFFLVVVTMDISFASGGMTGFILLSQHIGPLEIEISSPKFFGYLQTPYRIFYGLLNFEYFKIEQLSFCLWENFQVLDIIVFKYITILIGFLLVIVFIAILQVNACQRFFHLKRRVRASSSIVHGLSAVLVTCYVQCTKTSFYILKFVAPVGYNGKASMYNYSFYGGLIYFSPRYLIYAVPALLSLVVVTILPPFILILNPLALKMLSVCGLSEHWLVDKVLQFTCANKLMPFIDCFQGCYKDELRFFSGLHFMYRVAILLCFSLVQTSIDMQIYTTGIIVVILGIHSIAQPYRNKTHNVVNLLALLDFMLISICAICASSSKTAHESSYDYDIGSDILLLGCLQLMLIYLPVIVALCVAARRAFSYVKARRGETELEEELQDSVDIGQYRQLR